MRMIKGAREGDTMIEVLFAISVLSLVSVLSIIVMNAGVATAETTLEISMARNEIDAQSEALRFIHNSFVSERSFGSRFRYKDIWKAIVEKVNTGASAQNAIIPLSTENCSDRYDASKADSIFRRKTMILNTHLDFGYSDPNDTIISAEASKFVPAPLYPRVIYESTSSDRGEEAVYDSYALVNTDVKKAEGIWIIPVAQYKGSGVPPEFYDFHIYTCWNAPGQNRPTTIGTIIRLYNPEYIEVDS